jgi:predicted HAD superfamily phosphohydrolase
MQNTDTIKQVISRVDTLYVDRVDPLYHEAYIKLLERSNEQLSLVGNPLAWMIGALGVLFTVGAIVAAFLLWRQSREFKEDQKKLIDTASSEIFQLQLNLKSQSEILLNRLTASVTEIEQKTQSLEPVDKEDIVKQLDDLKSDLEWVKSSNSELNSLWKTIKNADENDRIRVLDFLENLRSNDFKNKNDFKSALFKILNDNKNNTSF